MAEAPAPEPPLPNPNAPGSGGAVHFWSVFAWLALQMLALIAAGYRVPFSARFPAPEERLAMHEMLIVQVTASALLFPVLFPTFATGVLVIAATPVMVLLSAGLAGRPVDGTVVGLGIYSTVWVAGLGMWRFGLGKSRVPLQGVAGATFLAVGGVVLAYLGREFGAPTEGFDWRAKGWLGPIVGGLSILESGAASGRAWAFLGLFVIAGAGAAGMGWTRRRGKP